MAFNVSITSSAPPDRVLQAIRENLREWRESRIPPVLWKQGVLQVVGGTDDFRFYLRFDRRWQGKGGNPLRLVGQVRSAGSGSSITARCGKPGVAQWLAGLFGLMVLWNVAAGHGIPWDVVTVGAVSVLISLAVDSAVSRDDPEAAYLEARLLEAVAAADSEAASKQAPA